MSLAIPTPSVILIGASTAIWGSTGDPWTIASACLMGMASWSTHDGTSVNIMVIFVDGTHARFAVTIYHANRTGFDLKAAYEEILWRMADLG